MNMLAVKYICFTVMISTQWPKHSTTFIMTIFVINEMWYRSAIDLDKKSYTWYKTRKPHKGAAVIGARMHGVANCRKFKSPMTLTLDQVKVISPSGLVTSAHLYHPPQTKLPRWKSEKLCGRTFGRLQFTRSSVGDDLKWDGRAKF